MSSVVAKSVAGLVRGVVEQSGVSVFRGVPFAAPPVGRLRFAPPASVEPWDGLRDAIEYGPASIQNVDPLSMVMPGAERNYYQTATAVFSEDCLNLNIFTPGVDEKSRPVLVWIHGGGFITGSGSGEWYDGTNLALKNDVVVVTINYRLGILGGIYLGDVDPDATNFGLRDQQAALAWVRANIAEFGGDPHNVTVWGQSAGGMAVGALVVSPLSEGLFEHAIMQSGNVANFVPLDYALQIRQGILDALHIDRASLLDQLREVSTPRLLEVQRALSPLMFPVLDDRSIPADPIAALRDGRAADVSLLIGNTAAENKLFHLISMPTPGPDFNFIASLETFIGVGSGDIAKQAATLYRNASDRPDSDLWDFATSDAGWVLPSRQFADAHATAGRPTFSFELSIESTALGGIVGAAHEVDVPFVFDALDLKGVEELLGAELVADPAARALASNISAAWATFARTGVPALESIEVWPRYEATSRATVILDRFSHVSTEHNREKLDFWAAHAPAFPLGVLGQEI